MQIQCWGHWKITGLLYLYWPIRLGCYAMGLPISDSVWNCGRSLVLWVPGTSGSIGNGILGEYFPEREYNLLYPKRTRKRSKFQPCTRLKWLWSWLDVTTRTIFTDASKDSSCPLEIPCARPKRHRTGVATTCSFSVCEMFDLGTSQRPVPLKTSVRFCRRAPRSCKQFPASNSSPDSSRRHDLRFRRICFTQVSGIPGDICYCITNNGRYISNLKLHAIALLSFQAGEETMFAWFLSTL